MGVLSKYQGKGLGGQLIEGFERRLLEKNINEVSLTTDLENNDSAKRFYWSLGYETMYIFIAYPGRKMIRLIKRIPKQL